jgi:hypothetical protein
MTVIIVKGSRDRLVRLQKDLRDKHARHYGINKEKSHEALHDFKNLNDTCGLFTEKNRAEHIQSFTVDFQKMKEKHGKKGIE